MHTKNGWVYKFQNPRNGKTFNIKLELQKFYLEIFVWNLG